MVRIEHFFRLVLAAFVICFISACGKIDTLVLTDSSEQLPVGILCVGAHEAVVVNRLMSLISGQFGCEVFSSSLAEDESKNNFSRERIASTIRSQYGSKVSYALCLIDAQADGLQFSALTIIDDKSALINIAAFRFDASGQPVSEEIFFRRIEKAAMSLLGQMVGLEACPMPQCALFSVSGIDDLDMKGRGFCPPCGQRARVVLSQKGIKPLREEAGI